MIQRLLRYLCGLAGLLFLALGLVLLFFPGRLIDLFAVLPVGNAGLSTLRADLGGLFLGMAVFSLMGAIGASWRWLTVPLVFLGFILLGRMLNLLLDGSSGEGVRALGLEVVLAAVFLLAMASLRGSLPVRLGLAVAAPVLLLVGLGSAYVFQRQIGMMLTRSFVERAFQSRLLETLPDGLHAGLCGTGSPMPDATRAGPCIFVIAGKRVYVVDVGEGSPRKISLMGLSPGLIDAILLTHFHSDHIAGLGELMLQRWANGSHADPVEVIGPQGVESVVQGFNDAYALDKGYRIAHHGAATVPPSGAGGLARPFKLAQGSDASQVLLQRDGLTITAFPVPHGPVFPAVGFRFDYRGRSLVISGDTSASPTLARNARGADVLFHEGLQTAMVSIQHDAAVRNAQPGLAKITADIPSYHATPEEAARIAQQAGVRQLVFYHMIPPLPLAYLNAAFLGDAAQSFGGPISVAKDGMFFSLPADGGAVTTKRLL